MKKLLFTLLIVLALSLSACSMTGFAPWSSSESNSTVNLTDDFEFVDVTNNTSDVISLDNDSDVVVTEVEEKNNSAESLILTTISVVEGDLVSLADLLAEDPDGDSIEYSYSQPFNTRGLWQTNDGDEGKYLVEITATDGLLSTTEQVRIIVTASNKGPVIDCPASFAVFEGDLIELPCVIYDQEGDKVSYSVTGFMSDLTYQTNYDDAGSYVVIVSASDGYKTTVKEIALDIANKNRQPVVSNVGEIDVMEGEDVVISLDVSDADGDDITITYPERFNDQGVWSTVKGDAGSYELEVSVFDGTSTVVVPVKVVVGKVNSAPIIESIPDLEYDEGDIISLPIKVLDEDGDELTIDVSGFMNDYVYQTTYKDAGTHSVTISVSDGKTTVTEDVTIVINDVNRAPVFIVK